MVYLQAPSIISGKLTLIDLVDVIDTPAWCAAWESDMDQIAYYVDPWKNDIKQFGTIFTTPLKKSQI